MTKYLAHSMIAAATIVLAASPARSQETPPLRIDQLMSAQDMSVTGISRLSARQLAALEEWLARYTTTVTAVIQGAERSGARPRSRPAQPAEMYRAPRIEAPDTIRPRTVPNGVRIYRTAGGGTFVMLEDGTMWEIYLPDSPAIATWREGDFILVRERPAPIGEYSYLLLNSQGRSSASARFAGWIEPGGAAR